MVPSASLGAHICTRRVSALVASGQPLYIDSGCGRIKRKGRLDHNVKWSRYGIAPVDLARRPCPSMDRVKESEFVFL
ncbi:unnamed protein product [Chondrus crispus]|uniref:Uncharacterized protein n=1 Tax=Chondrus crispus TaxID=2769 RepID=R7QNE2_CHOCR|nr:unnamed protein product [Chondrus crispus]CDF38910.1 unnamed protein product [Chondrus crispus]|eukprot:XP_005718815.1 unnamed protein product [Chondrus crispus]